MLMGAVVAEVPPPCGLVVVVLLAAEPLGLAEFGAVPLGTVGLAVSAPVPAPTALLPLIWPGFPVAGLVVPFKPLPGTVGFMDVAPVEGLKPLPLTGFAVEPLPVVPPFAMPGTPVPLLLEEEEEEDVPVPLLLLAPLPERPVVFPLTEPAVPTVVEPVERPLEMFPLALVPTLPPTEPPLPPMPPPAPPAELPPPPGAAIPQVNVASEMPAVIASFL